MLPHLRVKTEYSFRQAYGPVKDVAAALAELGCKTAGIVDTRGTWGHVSWEKALKEHEIQPAFGAEFEIPNEAGRKPRCWVLAENLRQFYRLSSSQPSTPEELAQAKGVIRFSGAALTDPETFDYIDVNPRSLRRQRQALELARRTGKPLVVTGDNDYPTPADRLKFLAWDDSKRMTPQHILNEQELRAALPLLDDATWEAACRNAYEIEERLQGIKLEAAPIISVPGDLAALVEEGRKYRLKAGHIKDWTPTYQQRLERELQLIREKAYDSYFIVVADLVVWAKTQMLVGPARGSSAGSLVCYLLQITEVDPLVHDLIFERFIDVNRDDLPDIDIDFNDQKRHLVVDYLARKYGADCVAHIGNINRLKPRSVMAHVAKKMGIPHGATFSVTNVLIEYSSGDSRYGKGLEDTLTGTQPGKDFLERYPEAVLMGELENHASHTGVHAAGIIVSNEPVVEFCTVHDGIAHVDKKDAEYLNLLKIDALGLRTLGVIEDAGCVTNEQLYALEFNDPNVLRIFDQGKFSGLFQFEGGAQRRVSLQVPITDFKKIDHVTALARPGPLGGGAAGSYINRNLGAEEVTYRHPSMKEYLGDTMGVVLYQEQVMRIVRELGCFSWEETSTIRKAMSGRKGKEFFDQRGRMFVEGAATHGINEEEAKQIWDEICSFGAWGMNKCISLNSKIKLAHPNQFLGADPTIEALYKYYKEAPTAWIRQRNAMPKLLAVGEDGIARPTQAVDIIKTGEKPCVRLTFEDGRVVECTKEHKFIINGEWQACGKAKPGDEFDASERLSRIKNHAFNPGGKGWRKGRQGGAGDSINRRDPTARNFRAEMRGKPCSRCGEHKQRMVVHHNDHCHGKERPQDLAWLCDGCHKKVHVDAGDWLPPYARGWERAEPAVLVSTEDAGIQQTYDIEMPEPNHNYVLANGIVTHNSHTTSYAMISYWCAYMKCYHPLEYAAACLRSAKDDEQTVEILRELSAEGVHVTPFDPQLSDINWSAKEGQLLGGYTNLHGIGPVKARAYVEKRATKGLDEKDLEKLAKHEVKHKDLRPAHTLWGDIYDRPTDHNIYGKVKEFAELEDGENAVVICRMIRNERRDENETVRLAKRGYAKEGQTLFLDMFVVDDSVSKPVVARLRPEMWTEAEQIADRAVAGQEWFLLRGRWLKQFSMMIVKKIKCLSNPEVTR